MGVFGVFVASKILYRKEEQRLLTSQNQSKDIGIKSFDNDFETEGWNPNSKLLGNNLGSVW